MTEPLSENVTKNVQPESAGVSGKSDRDFYAAADMPDIRQGEFKVKLTPEIRIMIDRSVHEEIISHAGENTQIELCGILVGELFKDFQGPFLHIQGAIKGVNAKNEGAQVTFTHSTWDHIHTEMDTRFKGRKIVGWYHTHPGFGIFLSDMDKFIHEYFFDQVFQIALVIDPIALKEGVFAWRCGEIVSLNRYWIGAEEKALAAGGVGSRAPLDSCKIPDNSLEIVTVKRNPTNPAADGNSAKHAVFLLIAFFLGFSLASIMLAQQIRIAFRDAANAEIREIIAIMGMSFGGKQSLEILDKKLFNFQHSLEASPASITTELIGETEEIRRLLSGLSSAMDAQEEKFRTVLKSRAFESMTLAERLTRMRSEVDDINRFIAAAYFQEVKRIIEHSQKPEDLKVAKELIKQAIRISPDIESEFRHAFPDMFVTGR